MQRNAFVWAVQILICAALFYSELFINNRKFCFYILFYKLWTLKKRMRICFFDNV